MTFCVILFYYMQYFFCLIYLFILASYLSVFGGNIYFLCLVIQINNSYCAYRGINVTNSQGFDLNPIISFYVSQRKFTLWLVTGFSTRCPKVVTTTVSLVPSRSSSLSPFLIQIFSEPSSNIKSLSFPDLTHSQFLPTLFLQALPCQLLLDRKALLKDLFVKELLFLVLYQIRSLGWFNHNSHVKVLDFVSFIIRK